MFLSGTVVLNGGIIIGKSGSKTGARDINIARVVNGDGQGYVSSIVWSTVGCNPSFQPGWVILDRDVVLVVSIWICTLAGYIGVA